MEWWVPVEKFWKGTDSMIEHLFFKADETTVDEGESTTFVDFHTGFEIETEHEWPNRTLVVGSITLLLSSLIDRIIGSALR